MGRGNIPTITLSFKDTPEDIQLRDWLMTKSNRSGFIKDNLRKAMIEEKEREEKLKQLYKN